MKKHLLNYLVLVYYLGVPPAYGNNIFENIIRMECDQYQTHHKKIVIFPHLKHAKRLGISCGECHHDDSGDPQENLGINDDVDSCIECHSIPTYVTGKPNIEQLEYHTNALHFKCKYCHRLYNKRMGVASSGEKQAPTKCNQCHRSENSQKNKNEY